VRRFTSTEAKQNFGQLMDAAQRAPVLIEKNGRPAAVILSYEDFRHIEALEDAYWGERAREADERGDYLSAEESEALVKDLLGADA
jgi:antitoxin Phd